MSARDDIEAAWKLELDRRAAEVEAGTADTMTLDEYREHRKSRLHAGAKLETE